MTKRATAGTCHRAARASALSVALATTSCGARTTADLVRLDGGDAQDAAPGAPAHTEPSSWPMRGGSASNRRVGADPAPGDPRWLWTFEPPGGRRPWSSPVVGDDGSIYFVAFGYEYGDSPNEPRLVGPTLYALSPGGTERWALDGVHHATDPALGIDGSIYVGMGTELVALGTDGARRWVVGAGGRVGSAVVVARDGTIHFGATDGRIYAVRPGGTLAWTVEVTAPDSSAELAVDESGTVYATTSGYPLQLVAVSRQGLVLWRTTIPTYTGLSPTAPAIAADGTVYVSWDGLRAYSSEGALEWTFDVPLWDCAESPAVGPDGTVYVSLRRSSSSGLEGRLVAVAPHGAELWSAPIDFGETPPTVASDGAIYTAEPVQIFAPDGSLLVSSEQEEQVLTSPALGARGTYYFGVPSGLRAFGE